MWRTIKALAPINVRIAKLLRARPNLTVTYRLRKTRRRTPSKMKRTHLKGSQRNPAKARREARKLLKSNSVLTLTLLWLKNRKMHHPKRKRKSEQLLANLRKSSLS
jgi:hypothetical protein